jgi:hypothetical protein
MSWKTKFFKNVYPIKISDSLVKLTSLKNNKNKFLKVKEDESGIEWSDIILDQKYFDSDQFSVKDNIVRINELFKKEEALELFALKEHKHTILDIEDFKDNRYVHIAGDETIEGQKTFRNKVIFKNDVIFKGEVTRIDASETLFKDEIITLAKSNFDIKPAESGIEIYRGKNLTAKLLWIEKEKKWKIGIDNLDAIATQSQIDEIIESLNNIKNILQNLKLKSIDYFKKIDFILSIKEYTEYLVLPEGKNKLELKYNVYAGKNHSVFRNGIIQIPNSDYKLNNNVLEFFESAQDGDDKILIQYSYIKDN